VEGLSDAVAATNLLAMLDLELLPEAYAVCRLPAGIALPPSLGAQAGSVLVPRGSPGRGHGGVEHGRSPDLEFVTA